MEESSDGTQVTYWFKLKTNDEVYVIYDDSQVHIPAICTKSVKGNQIKCKG